MSNLPEQLKSLYKELDRLKGSGEDVVADIRAEINNLELEYLNKEVFPKIAKSLGSKLATLRCEIDFSLQFDGSGKIDYSFCTSGSSIMMRDSFVVDQNVSQQSALLLEENSSPLDINNDNHKFSAEKTCYIPNVVMDKRNDYSRETVRIGEYSSRSFVVYGTLTSITNELRDRGGYYSSHLRGGKGWVFSKEIETEIRTLLAENQIVLVEVDATFKQDNIIAPKEKKSNRKHADDLEFSNKPLKPVSANNGKPSSISRTKSDTSRRKIQPSTPKHDKIDKSYVESESPTAENPIIKFLGGGKRLQMLIEPLENFKKRQVSPEQVTSSVNEEISLFSHVDVIDPALTSVPSSSNNKNYLEERFANGIVLVQYSKKAIAVYGAPTNIYEELQARGGYFNNYLRGGAGWIFSKKRENQIRAFLSDNIEIIENALDIENHDQKKISTLRVVSAREFRQQFIDFLREFINKGQKEDYIKSFIDLYVNALDSDLPIKIISKVSSAQNIYLIRDYVYIPRLLKIIETELKNSRKRAHLINALKYYHRFLYYRLNGKDISC